MDNNIKFDSNDSRISKKRHYRIYCLQRLTNIDIGAKILTFTNHVLRLLLNLFPYAGMEVCISIVVTYFL